MPSINGGPLVLMGIDAEDGGPGGHGPISSYINVVNGILSKVTNGGTGLLVIGGNKNSLDDVTRFWNAVATGIGETVTYVNGASITAQTFNGFKMIGIVSDILNTPFGGLTQAENDLLASRAGDIASFVNTGGGILGFSSDFTNPYAYLGSVGAFTVKTNLSYSNITATPEGLVLGINDALDVCCWHDEYVTFPSFLDILATEAVSTLPAAIGGQQVIIPQAVTINSTSSMYSIIAAALMKRSARRKNN